MSRRLDEMLDEHGGDLARTFAAYSAEMAPSRAGLVEVSMRNYEEMASKTNSTLFSLKRRVDALLEALAPGAWAPLYTMVTFSRMHYDEALRRAERQDRILAAAGFAALAVGAISVAVLGPRAAPFIRAGSPLALLQHFQQA